MKRLFSVLALFTACCLLFSGCTDESSVAVRWLLDFGGSGYEIFNGVIESSGRLITAGYSDSADGDLSSVTAQGMSDALLCAFDSDGNVQYKTLFGGSGHDVFNGLCEAPGGCTAAGYTQSGDGNLANTDYHGGSDAMLVKFDKTGTAKWVSAFGGSGDDVYFSVYETPDDGCVAVGRSTSADGTLESAGNAGVEDALIVKYDENGGVLWTDTFGGSGRDEFSSVVALPDGGYAAAGFTESNDGSLAGFGSADSRMALLVRYDKTGKVQWKQVFGGTAEDEFHSICLLSGNLLCVGASSSEDGQLSGKNAGEQDAVAVCYDTDGKIVWQQSFGGAEPDVFLAAAAAGSEAVVCGYTKSADGSLDGIENRGSFDALAVKLDENGIVKWTRTFGGNGWDRFNSVCRAGSGKYVFSGTTPSSDGDLEAAHTWGSNDALLVYYR